MFASGKAISKILGKKTVRIERVTFLTATLLTVIACSVVLGQRVGGEGAEQPKTRRSGVRVKTVVRTEVRVVTQTTGSLAVAANSNANLLVEPINARKAEGQRGVVPDGERIFIFNGLQPGEYRVAGTLAGHHPAEKEISIKANKNFSVTLDFEPIVFSVTVTTNVSTGELKYALAGQTLANVASLQNGRVQLKLPVGTYTLEITPGEFGYEPRRETVLLDHDQTIDLTLTRNLTTDTLSPTWTKAELQGWEMPTGWHADSKRNLLVKGPGMALPREVGFRHYKDFRIASSVKMNNRVAASFALRARDSKNYYLLQLTGENSDEPYVVRLFIVKDGVERRLRAITIPRSSATALANGEFFSVSIKMIDFQITVEVEDSQTGASYPLGVLTDPDHNFAVGAVGIGARNNEENVIGLFVVCTGNKCLNE